METVCLPSFNISPTYNVSLTFVFLFLFIYLFFIHFIASPFFLSFISQQSKCSMFRGVILCLCLNLTYANVVRFPRELDRHGVAFLLPYLLLLMFVGLPIVLLEIALGQFLGQDSAHSWRASPILRGKPATLASRNDQFKCFLSPTGASIVGRIASWLCAITVSMHGVLGMVYTGEILVKSVPFSQCNVDEVTDKRSRNRFRRKL